MRLRDLLMTGAASLGILSGAPDPDAADLLQDIADFAKPLPGAVDCFEVKPAGLHRYRVSFKKSLARCSAYLRHVWLADFVEPLAYTKFRMEDPGFPIPTTAGAPVYLGAIQSGASPAATINDPEPTVILQRRRFGTGAFACPNIYIAKYFPLPVNWGAVLAHEVGHARFARRFWRTHFIVRMWPAVLMPILAKNEVRDFDQRSNDAAVAGENDWWEAADPHGTRRLRHNVAPPCLAP